MSLMDSLQLLSCPSKAKRSQCLQELLDKSVINKSTAEILLEIENVPPSIIEFRNKERFLENLLQDLKSNDLIHCETTTPIVFRYLLGSLYINFEKFWGPTIRILTEILQQTKLQGQLLEILLDNLVITNDTIYQDGDISHMLSPEDRPDHVLHRNFLFQIMAKFAHHSDFDRTKFMDQFFRFVHKELMVSPFIEKFTRIDLKVKKDSQQAPDEQCITSDEIATEHSAKSAKLDPISKVLKKAASDSLMKKRKSRETYITAAKVIQLFPDLSKIHRSVELKDLLMNLLCCRDSSVQRATFNCIIVLDRNRISPYVDNLLKLLSDKKVRNELSVFSINSEEESSKVKVEDRPHLIPLLMRILFGRMLGQVGKKSSGHSKAESRKTLVMRFIAGCTTAEIMNYFALAFDPIFGYIDVPYRNLESSLVKDINIDSYIPLNKLQAMLETISSFIESVANLRPDSLPYVFKLINIIVFHTTYPLETPEIQEKISPSHIESLRNLRRCCMTTVAEYFLKFDYYEYAVEEVDFLFKHIIWPSCKGFVDKNHATVTPFLRLLESFAVDRVYHLLFVKRNEAIEDEYLIKHLSNLYADPKTKLEVLRHVSSIFVKLLLLDVDQDHEDSDQAMEIEPRTEIAVGNAKLPLLDERSFKLSHDIPVGHKILISFIPVIFDRLRRNCEDLVSKKDTSLKPDENELTILTTLSQYLKDSSQSSLATKLLLTTLPHQKKAHLIIHTLQTAQALMKQVTNSVDTDIINLIAEFLSFQRNVEQRKEMCNLLDVLAMVDSKLLPVSRVLRLMNTYSEELVDLPDLSKWNEGFHRAIELVESIETEQDEVVIGVLRATLVLLLHQIVFIINSADKYEFSIRENCAIFFEKLSKKLGALDDDTLLRNLIENILLDKFVRKGLRETNDQIKHTYIGVLRTFAVECNHKSKLLSEIHTFCDTNPELDFWLGIKHIQVHNRSKSLARLLSNPKLEIISPKTLSAYIMPIAAGFLFTRAYKSISSLAENSIKLIGIICRNLNWVTYEATLSYYLGLLTKANASYQRMNIKLITEIVKNFNFDITACEEAMQYEEENKKLEKRMMKRRGEGAVDDKGQVSVLATDAPSGKRLNPSTARMVYHGVTKKLIPRLNSCLNEMASVELEHDKRMSRSVPEMEDIKRIPIAFAIVQLLNLLPGRYVLMRDQLPALLLKITSFLKSKNVQVRKAARMTLVRVMDFVGPAYLPDMLRVLRQDLDKGFQVHVLNYSIHSVLEKMPLKYGDLDNSVHELVECCTQEIFGKVSEDKEVAQILAKTPEAKKTKSYDTLMITASYISAVKLDKLITPIKELLSTSTDPKAVSKLSVCIQRVFAGLALNSQFPVSKMLSFIQATIEESIPSLKVRQKVEQSAESNGISNQLLREDRYLIQKEKKRDRVKSKINEKGNFHMVVENSLKLLVSTLQNNRSSLKKSPSLHSNLDLFIPLLTKCLKSSSPRCVMRALKCIHFIARTIANLPNLEKKSNSLVKKIFILLSMYNGVGMVQGDNFEMIGMCFKTLTLLLLKCKGVDLNDEQIRALLTYVEQDLHDSRRQSTGFSTLKSILERKFESPELREIMDKVADLLVTSSEDSVRFAAIKSWQIYLLDYKHPKDMLQSHFTKFLRQLDYEFADGRRSVLEMIRVTVEKLPEKILRDHFELVFHLLAQRVINEEFKDIRLVVGKLISLLLRRLPDKREYMLNKFVFTWASCDQTELKVLALKLLSIVIESSDGKAFEGKKARVTKCLTLIYEALSISSKNNIANEKTNTTNELDDEMVVEEDEDQIQAEEKSQVLLVSTIDKLHYHSMRLLKRLINTRVISCMDCAHANELIKIWNSVASSMLMHQWDQVVLTGCELCLIFIRDTDLTAALNATQPSRDNLLDMYAKKLVRTLIDRYIDLLDRVKDDHEVLLQYITECLIRIGQVVAQSSSTLSFEKDYVNSFADKDVLGHLLRLENLPNDGFLHDHLPYAINESKRKVNLLWLSIKVVNQAKKEAALFRLNKHFRRNFVLKWTAAISQELGSSRISPYLTLFTMTPTRELTDKIKAKSEEGRNHQNTMLLAEDLLKFMKSLVGLDRFNQLYSKLQLHYTRRRIERKKKEAIIKVKDQARGVKRKMKQSKLKRIGRKKAKSQLSH